MKIKKGFTLSETLITLTILGVVAALTVPSLVNNVKQNIYKARWKKAYSEISEVMDLLAIQYPSAKSFQDIATIKMEETGLPRNAAILELLKSHFKHNAFGCDGSNCSTYGSSSGSWQCRNILADTLLWGDSYYKLNSSKAIGYVNWYLGYFNTSCLKTNNYSIGIFADNVNGNKIVVMVNNPKGKHVVGKDVFLIGVEDIRRIKPFGSKGYYDGASYACDKNGTGEACSAKYLYEK